MRRIPNCYSKRDSHVVFLNVASILVLIDPSDRLPILAHKPLFVFCFVFVIKPLEFLLLLKKEYTILVESKGVAYHDGPWH